MMTRDSFSPMGYILLHGDIIKSNKMDPMNIPFNTLISGPTNCGKTKYLTELLSNEFRFKFDCIVLLCPTFRHNKTWNRCSFVENDKDFLVFSSKQDQINRYLKLMSNVYEGTNTLIILDDCAVSKDVKQKTSELVELVFSGRHKRISLWVITQQITSIAKPFRENVAVLILFFTTSAKDMKFIFDKYVYALPKDEIKDMIKEMKKVKYSHLDFSLIHPYEIKLIN